MPGDHTGKVLSPPSLSQHLATIEAARDEAGEAPQPPIEAEGRGHSPDAKAASETSPTSRSHPKKRDMPAGKLLSAKRRKVSSNVKGSSDDHRKAAAQPLRSIPTGSEHDDANGTTRRSGRTRKQAAMWPKPAANVLPPPPPPGTKRLGWVYEDAATKEVFEETDPKYLAKLNKRKP
jgi:hypothetical protein